MNPIDGGMKAPPETAIIIKPEISFDLSGILLTATENIKGKRFPEPNPIRKMETKPTVDEGAKSIKMTLNKAIVEVITRNIPTVTDKKKNQIKAIEGMNCAKFSVTSKSFLM